MPLLAIVSVAVPVAVAVATIDARPVFVTTSPSMVARAWTQAAK